MNSISLFPEVAKQTNHSSLAELNAYIDYLEVSFNRDSECAQASIIARKSLLFFKPYKSISGKTISNRLSPFNIVLPTIHRDASEAEREAIAIRFQESVADCSVVRDIQVALNTTSSAFSSLPKPSPIFCSKTSQRDKLNELWEDMTADVIKRTSLYQANENYQRRIIAMQKYYIFFKQRCLKRILRIKNRKHKQRSLKKFTFNASQNKKKSKILLGNLHAKTLNAVYSRYGEDPPEPENSQAELLSKISITESGYHPDLLFMDKSLSEEQRKEASKRIHGEHLKNESDVWLIENVWKILRESSPPIPVIIITEDAFEVSPENGFIRIPYNFDLWKFVDFLELHLDDAQQRRQKFSLSSSQVFVCSPDTEERVSFG
ncbi:hypothetical protein IE077_004300 [Cardiosporidium cionae]|uniref:Uncharacterized protein n=1 Tax=Cardiosporidium cionae TaxID=476202 RepID=A0ABQ7JCH1_9APIC|nr:hypothetical protein IE077_004300 [Cardiosporidium cionae]|eukprot:KAF8821671.1 hypothetical protein IE077_004300 [Cardiosporidium cionae]